MFALHLILYFLIQLYEMLLLPIGSKPENHKVEFVFNCLHQMCHAVANVSCTLVAKIDFKGTEMWRQNTYIVLNAISTMQFLKKQIVGIAYFL